MVQRGLKRSWFVRSPEALDVLRSTLRQNYPSLHTDESGERIIVCGSFPISHGGSDLDWYLIEVTLPNDYPSSPCTVREVGGRIPRSPDRHVNADGTLCLAVAEELWTKWAGKFDLPNFLEGPVRTFLISNSLVEVGKAWPHGERAHGSAGVCEFYQETIGIGEPEQVLQLLGYLSKDRIKGHWPCPCGSGRKLRNCHSERILPFHDRIPRQVVQYSMSIVQNELRKSA
jgi:hypothetical protein